MKKFQRICALVVLLSLLCGSLCACTGGNVEDLVSSSTNVLINKKAVDTVEARMGAFSGKQGDTIEFRFAKASKLNTVYIVEKTAVITRYLLYAEVNGKFKLVYDGKQVFAQNITFDTVTATALKLEIMNTQPGAGDFTITGINAYYLEPTTVKS